MASVVVRVTVAAVPAKSGYKYVFSVPEDTLAFTVNSIPLIVEPAGTEKT